MPLDFNDLTAKVRETVESFRAPSMKETKNHVPEQPPTLHHYTGVNGFLGIATSGAIWATNTRYLNDAQELSHARSIAYNVIQRKLIDTYPDRFIDILLRYLHTYLDDYSVIDNYVASFCAVPDLLSQWRGYGRDIGYSLGFEPDEHLSTMPAAQHARIVKVLYDRDEQEKLISDRIDWYISPLTGLGGCSDWFDETTLRELAQIKPVVHPRVDYQGTNQLVKQALGLVDAACLCLRDELHGDFIRMKHSGFDEEREWRMVYTETGPTVEIKYRTLNGYIVPYVELPLFRVGGPTGSGSAGFKLTTVMCGPCNDPEAAKYSTTMWLQQMGFSFAQVENSETPYKTW